MPEKTESYDKQAAFERTKELTDKLEQGMKDLFSSDKYTEYLKSMSHFHNYSSRNIMLINMQMPGATRIASFKLWDEKFNRHVKKGEHGIRIFAPIATTEKKDFEKLDPETKAPLLDENGRVIMETLQSDSLRFKLVPVFDINQTYGDPLPELVENLTGDVAQYEAFLDSLKAVSPLPIEFEPLKANNDGYCRYGEKIGIREGMSEVQTVSAVIHEITHARLHDREKSSETAKGKSKDVKEVEAESISYVVCQHYAIETAGNSFGYLAEWGSRDMSEFKASLDTIRKESNNLINAIGDKFKAICQERGIDLSAKEPEQTAPETPPEPEFTTEERTENIAGVDFTFEEVKPVISEKEVGKPQTEIETPVPDEPPISKDPAEIMHDAAIGVSERDEYGYTDESMLPLTQDKALEMFDADHTVYLLYEDNTEAMAFERSEIENHNGIFGIEREDWQQSKEYTELSAQNSEAVRESDLIHSSADTYGIYQLKDGEQTRDYRFESLSNLESRNLSVERENYRLVYTSPLGENDTLNSLYEKFNLEHPTDFAGHSLSTSDIVVMQNGGNVSSHYVDNFGFSELPSFLGNEKQHETEQAPEHAVFTRSAVDSNYKDMVALVGADDKIYLGKSENYHFISAVEMPWHKEGQEYGAGQSYYNNADNSLLFVSENEKMYSMLYGDGSTVSQDEAYKQEAYNMRDFIEFAKLQKGVLNDLPYKDGFDGIKFGGEPFISPLEERQLNNDCVSAIGKAINENFDGYHLSQAAAKSVIDTFGADRVNLMLANTIQYLNHDGRFSSENKAWADKVEIPELQIPHENRNYYVSDAHPAILDGFTRQARKIVDEMKDKKPSVLEALKTNAERSKQISAPKKETSKNNGMEM